MTKRFAYGLVAVLVCVATGAVVGVPAYRRARDARETAHAWADFSSCVLGDPLAPGEGLDARTRGIEITLDRMDDPEAKLPSDAWPLACERSHAALSTSEAVGRTAPGLREAAYAGWRELVAGKKRSLVGLGPAFEIAARSVEIVPASPGALRAPPPAVPIIRRHRATPLAPGAPTSSEPNAEGPEEVHRAADGTITRVVPVIGTPRWGLESTYRLVRHAPSEAAPVRLDLPPGEDELHVVGDALIGRVGSDLVARIIQPTGPLLGPPIRLDRAHSHVRWSWCPKSALGAFGWSDKRDLDFDESFDELRVVEAPSYRLVTTVPLGMRAGPPAMECTSDGATFVWIESKIDTHVVRRLRCQRTGCKEDSREVSGIRPAGFFVSKNGLDRAIRAAPLGDDDVAVVWKGRADAVWFSAGPFVDLATARRQVLYDVSREALEAEGVDKPWCDRLQLEAHQGGAKLTLRMGPRAAMHFDIARDGHASAVEE